MSHERLRNKEEFYYGPYTSQNRNFWLKQNKLRRARVLRDVKMECGTSPEQVNLKIFKRGKMQKNFSSKVMYEEFINNLVNEQKRMKASDLYMSFDKNTNEHQVKA